jgi:hypothetical protein
MASAPFYQSGLAIAMQKRQIQGAAAKQKYRPNAVAGRIVLSE